MTKKLEQAARQIIVDWDSGIHLYEAITALREALSEQAEQDPVGYFTYDGDYNIWEEVISKDTYGAVPLYAHPELPKFSALAAEYSRGREDGYEAGVQFMKEQAEQEPVAYLSPNGKALHPNEVTAGEHSSGQFLAVYAAPVRTKDLTDDEIEELTFQFDLDDDLEFARAVIAADREKNK